jgi:ribulose-5-phosphate 4-epimerase/fuculose-1-phosphate aldolase
MQYNVGNRTMTMETTTRPYDAERQQIVAACQALVDQGYLMATGGNLSVRVAGQEALAITPSNQDYAQMTAGDVCVLDLNGTLLAGGTPSIESGMHATIYLARPDIHAIIHTHQAYASALALIKAPIPALFDEQVRFLGRSVEIIPYAPSGTGWLQNKIARAAKNGHNAYILQNHGALCFGHDLERAINNVEILEKCAVAYLLALCTERNVSKIPLAVREMIFAMLRKEEKRHAQGGA